MEKENNEYSEDKEMEEYYSAWGLEYDEGTISCERCEKVLFDEDDEGAGPFLPDPQDLICDCQLTSDEEDEFYHKFLRNLIEGAKDER